MPIKDEKKFFSDALNTILNENIANNKTTYLKYSQWLKQLYFKYINNTLTEEYKEILDQKLKKRNITIEEFLETEGELDEFIALYTGKKDPCRKTSPEEKIKILKDKNKELIAANEAAKSKSDKTIADLTQELKKKNKEIDSLQAEIDGHSKRTDLYTAKYEKLKTESDEEKAGLKATIKERDNTITTLAKKNSSLQKELEERDAKIRRLKSKSDEEKLKATIREQDKTITTLNKKNSSFQKELEETKGKLKTEIATRDREIKELKAEIAEKNDTQKIKTIGKKRLLKLLCSKDIVTIQEIKNCLIDAKIPPEDILAILYELRCEIPSIIQSMDKNGKDILYTIQGNATKRLNEFQNMNFCPSLSNIQDGTIECILVADFHLKENSLDAMKRKLDPFFDFSSKNRNVPITNFGDIQDSIYYMKKNKRLSDKDVIKYTYTFWENYAKALATCPETEHFTEFGNHEEEVYFRGIDPLEIINNNCNNFTFLGINQGAIKVGNDKIGIYHKLHSLPNAYTIQETYNSICADVKNIIKDNIYFFMGHLHISRHNPSLGFSLIGNDTENALYCTIEMKAGSVEKIYLTRLILLYNNELCICGNPIEVYNKNAHQYTKS